MKSDSSWHHHTCCQEDGNQLSRHTVCLTNKKTNTLLLFDISYINNINKNVVHENFSLRVDQDHY